jgi:hypothetical protein
MTISDPAGLGGGKTAEDIFPEKPTERTDTEENADDNKVVDMEASHSIRSTVRDGHDPANDQQQRTGLRSSRFSTHDQELATIPKRIGKELSQDTFSFLLVLDYSKNKIIFVAAVGIWVFQVSIFLLVFLNSFEIKGGDSSNKFSFPPDVDIATRIAEVRLPAERIFC